MKDLFDCLPAQIKGAKADTPENLLPLLVTELGAGSTVMVKGSFGSRMRVVVAGLRDAASAQVKA